MPAGVPVPLSGSFQDSIPEYDRPSPRNVTISGRYHCSRKEDVHRVHHPAAHVEPVRVIVPNESKHGIGGYSCEARAVRVDTAAESETVQGSSWVSVKT